MDVRLHDRPVAIIVDDDAALLGALAFSLELEGFRVEPHATGGTLDPSRLPAWNACLIIDQYLPDKTGLEVLRDLRAQKVNVPAVVITSHATSSLRAAAKRLGAAVVLKPLLGGELLAAIRAKINLPHSEPSPCPQ